MAGAVDELWQLVGGLPTIVSSDRKPKVVMCSGDDFVSMARAPSLATDTKNDLWLKLLTEGFVGTLLSFVGGLGTSGRSTIGPRWC